MNNKRLARLAFVFNLFVSAFFCFCGMCVCSFCCSFARTHTHRVNRCTLATSSSSSLLPPPPLLASPLSKWHFSSLLFSNRYYWSGPHCIVFLFCGCLDFVSLLTISTVEHWTWTFSSKYMEMETLWMNMFRGKNRCIQNEYTLSLSHTLSSVCCQKISTSHFRLNFGH